MISDNRTEHVQPNNAFHCIYMRIGDGGPMLVKTPKGLAFLYCASENLARQCIEDAKLPESSVPILAAELDTPSYPIPSQWRDITSVLLLDSEATLHLFLSDRERFPFHQHMGPDRIA